MIWEGCPLREHSWGGGLGASARSPGTAAQVVVTTLWGRKGAPLLPRKKSVALSCKMEAFGVGDGQPGSTVSKSSSVGCVVPAQRQAGTAGGDAGCRL